MGKKLSEMSLEELWELFPIFFDRVSKLLERLVQRRGKMLKNLLSQADRISHIGSTAVNSIWAKPIIDILVEMPRECDLTSIQNLLVNNGYICMNQSERRISFNKGYTENGFAERVFYLHLRYTDAKADFIKKNISEAKALYGSRY